MHVPYQYRRQFNCSRHRDVKCTIYVLRQYTWCMAPK